MRGRGLARTELPLQGPRLPARRQARVSAAMGSMAYFYLQISIGAAVEGLRRLAIASRMVQSGVARAPVRPPRSSLPPPPAADA